MGDIHDGTLACDEKQLAKDISYIANANNIFWFGLGDYADWILLGDKRLRVETLHPEIRDNLDTATDVQLERLERLFSPIKDKCLGLVEGNHDAKMLKLHSTDVTKRLCKALDVENLGAEALVRLHFEHMKGGAVKSKTIHLHHGKGGGSTAGAALNTLQRSMLGYPADIYAMGHVHGLATKKIDRVGLPQSVKFDENGIARPPLKSETIVLSVGGSYLRKHIPSEPKNYKWERGPITYAEEARYNPSTIGQPHLEIHMKDNKVTITV